MTVRQSVASRTAANAQILARVGLCSALLGLVLFIALHLVKRELDPAWHMVSEYALGRHGWAMTLCFVSLSLSCATSVLAIIPFTPTIGGKIGRLFLLCASVGLALASIFPTDPIALGPTAPSPDAKLHALSVMIGVPALTIAVLLVSFSLRQKPMWKGLRLPLIGFAHLIWISTALMIAVVVIWMPRSGGFGPSVPVGWPNRLMFIAYFGWFGTLSWPIATRRISEI